jgi:hypothetical protein
MGQPVSVLRGFHESVGSQKTVRISLSAPFVGWRQKYFPVKRQHHRKASQPGQVLDVKPFMDDEERTVALAVPRYQYIMVYHLIHLSSRVRRLGVNRRAHRYRHSFFPAHCRCDRTNRNHVDESSIVFQRVHRDKDIRFARNAQQLSCYTLKKLGRESHVGFFSLGDAVSPSSLRCDSRSQAVGSGHEVHTRG